MKSKKDKINHNQQTKQDLSIVDNIIVTDDTLDKTADIILK